MEEQQQFPNQRKLHPMVASLPDYLKDSANFDKIQMAILDAGATKHSHGDVGEWASCISCQQKEWDRKEMMIKLGFQSAAQYKAWQKIHTKIKERNPLVKWK